MLLLLLLLVLPFCKEAVLLLKHVRLGRWCNLPATYFEFLFGATIRVLVPR